MRKTEKVLGIPAILDDDDIEALVEGTSNTKCLELYLSLFTTACSVVIHFTELTQKRKGR